MVSGILAYKFGAPFAWITSLSVAAYIAFTLTVTQVPYFLPILYQDPWCSLWGLKLVICLTFSCYFQWRTKFRKAMNKADNDASTRAIDSLINYEVRLYSHYEDFSFYCQFIKSFYLFVIDNDSFFPLYGPILMPYLLFFLGPHISDCKIFQQWSFWSRKVWWVLTE